MTSSEVVQELRLRLFVLNDLYHKGEVKWKQVEPLWKILWNPDLTDRDLYQKLDRLIKLDEETTKELRSLGYIQ